MLENPDFRVLDTQKLEKLVFPSKTSTTVNTTKTVGKPAHSIIHSF